MAAKRPSRGYSAMFSSILFGLYFLVTGLIGYRTDRLAAARWAGHPIFWQIAMGCVFLLVGAYLFRRLGVGQWVVIAGRIDRRIKNVGKGQSEGAQRKDQHRLPAPDP